MEYKKLDIKYHFGDKVIYKDKSRIVIGYKQEDGLYEIATDKERKRSYEKEDDKRIMGDKTRVGERVLKRDFKGEMKEELEIVDMSRDIVKAHKQLLDKINANKKWYQKIFN